MYVTYGNYVHADGEVAVQISNFPMRNEGGQFYQTKTTWVLRGMLVASTQAALIVAIAALEAAYRLDARNLQLFTSAGVLAYRMLSGLALGGTRVIRLTYPEDGSRDAEYTTFRRYEIEVEGIFPIAGFELLAWSEKLVRVGAGGSSKAIFYQPLLLPPQKQLVAANTTYKVLQVGRAVGRTGPILPPPPIWPADVHWDQVQTEQDSGKWFGTGANRVYTEFQTSWQYPMEATLPFLGNPTLCP